MKTTQFAALITAAGLWAQSATPSPQPDEILRIGRSGKAESIPSLKAMLKAPGLDARRATAIRMALARLCDEDSFQFLVRDLTIATAPEVMRQLEYVGGERTLRFLQTLLLNPDRSVAAQGDVVQLPLAFHASKTLAVIVDDPPVPLGEPCWRYTPARWSR